MSWQILALLSVITYSFSSILQRVILKESNSHPMAFTILFQLFVGLFILLYGFAFSKMTLPDLRPLAFNLTLATLLYATGNIFIFKALKITEASKFSIIFSSRTLFTILAS